MPGSRRTFVQGLIGGAAAASPVARAVDTVSAASPYAPLPPPANEPTVTMLEAGSSRIELVIEGRPFALPPATFAGWVNREQAQVVSYLVEENRVLREQLGKRRLRLTDDQRRRLAAKGKILGRSILGEVATIVTPDTLLRWHRQLVANKYDGSAKQGLGRPRIQRKSRP